MGWKVGDIKNTILTDVRDIGFGFHITTDRGKPIAYFAYSSREEAEAAHKHMVAALKGVRLAQWTRELMPSHYLKLDWAVVFFQSLLQLFPIRFAHRIAGEVAPECN